MATAEQLIRDRRRFSRVPAQLPCLFTHGTATRPATITDISLGGALLTSEFLPPIGSSVTISLETSQSSIPLTLSATVIHASRRSSKKGDVSRFGVRFGGTATGLMRLIHSLIARAEDRT